MSRPVNPKQVPGLRQDFNTFDVSVPSSSSMLFKWPRDIGSEGKENEPAMLFKFHSPVAGAKEPEYPLLQGKGRYIGLPLPEELSFADGYKYDDSGSLRSIAVALAKALGRAYDSVTSLSGRGITLRRSGTAINPAAAITFVSPEFRSYSFSWNLYAKSRQDALDIFAIIQLFRIAAASQYDTNEEGNDLKYPHLVSFVVAVGADHPFPASYPSFIESVKFSPISGDEQVPLFADGQPVGWKLNLELKESMWIDRRELAMSQREQGF